ncbi:MAG: class II glutamine amidotransferase [Nitrosomonadaceae bacterium]
MCRFALYMGPEIRMGSLVTEPTHSIIVQSYQSEEREEPLNRDGFGVAWYPPDKGEAPAVFKSVSPAWNDQNLLNLSRVIHSHCILAHVRAASPGLPVTQLNCHPFAWEQFAFMHNGRINEFQTVKRQLRRKLSDSSYAWMQGTTDSETIFALFADIYSALKGESSAEKIATAVLATIESIEVLLTSVGNTAGCNLNLAVSDGRSAVVSRYSTKGTTPNSLYVNTGHRYTCEAGNTKLFPCKEPTVLVASEPLTPDASWHLIEPNHIVVINELLEVDIRPVVIH